MDLCIIVLTNEKVHRQSQSSLGGSIVVVEVVKVVLRVVVMNRKMLSLEYTQREFHG